MKEFNLTGFYNTKMGSIDQLVKIFKAIGIELDDAQGYKNRKITTKNGDIIVSVWSSSTWHRSSEVYLEGIELRVRTATHKDIRRLVRTKVRHLEGGGSQIVINLDRLQVKVDELTELLVEVKKGWDADRKRQERMNIRRDTVTGWNRDGKIPEGVHVASNRREDDNWVSISVAVDEERAMRILRFLDDLILKG